MFSAILSVAAFVVIVVILFRKSKERVFGMPSKTADGGGEKPQSDL